jgi:hypothetical protein
LVKEIYTFYLDQTLCNLEVCSSTFIRLNLLTQLAKTVKIEASLSNDVSLIFSSLSLNDTSFRVFNLGLKFFDWVLVLPICFNYTHNCLQTFNFILFNPCQTQLLAPKLTTFIIMVLASKFMYFYAQLTNKLPISSI